MVVASTAISIGGTVLGHKAQNDAHDANKSSALDALKVKDHELSLEAVQERLAGAQKRSQGDATALSAEGDVRASAASRGVSGLTTDLLIGDIGRQRAQYNDSVDQNTDMSLAQIDAQKDAAGAEARGRIAGVPGANPFLTGLKIAGSVLDAGSAIYKKNNPKGS